jgi:PAP2 superfamily
MTQVKKILLSFLLFFTFTISAFAGSGPLGIDHELSRSDTGIWRRSNQVGLEFGSAILVFGGSLYFGSDSRIGKTFWQSTDSIVMTSVSSIALKEVFRRERPNQGNNPNAWFKSSSNQSFPSGEVAHITAVVTPFIKEYQNDNPWIWSLAALPVYDGIARMKSQAHWQTDVIAGALLGGGIGYYNSTRNTPWSVTILPRSVTIGFNKSF